MLKKLFDTLPQVGTVQWISVRPKRLEPVEELDAVFADIDTGLEGDHYSGKANSKRQVTLIQAEHIQAIASFMGKDALSPTIFRRNIVVKGINLLALKDKEFQIGDAVLKMTGSCHPCSRMEKALGAGGYNAMRGHGGITATIIKGGTIRVGDKIELRVES